MAGGQGNAVRAQSISVPDGDGTREAIPDEVNGVSVVGYFLTVLAANECGIHAGDGGMNRRFRDAARGARGAWDPDAWYLFEGKKNPSSGATAFASCDDILFHEEALLCTASKLEEVASAVEPIVWESVYGRPPWVGPDIQNNPVILPPQSQKNRFIVRDLALNVLAHLGRLDLEKPSAITETTCAQAYASAAASPGSASAVNLFGAASGQRAPYFLPYDLNINEMTEPAYKTDYEKGVFWGPKIDSSTIPVMAGKRLEHQAKVLREAGVLLKRLIKDSVYADAAGATELRGNAADPKLGAELYWGVRTPDNKLLPYNSMAHVARTLFGRVEYTAIATAATMDPNNAPYPYADPRCSTYGKDEVLVGSAILGLDPAVGVDWKARWEGAPMDSPEKLRASRLMDSMGIVLPNDVVRQDDLSGVRAAVTEQAQLQAARVLGITSTTAPEFAAFQASTTGQIVAEQIGSLRDTDLRFGLDRSRGAFEQLTATRATSTVTLTAGLPANTAVSSSLASLGVVVNNGLPRADATTDIMSRLAGAQAASQCQEYGLAPTGTPPPTAESQKVAAFQSPFVLGDVFRQRLSSMRDLVESEGIGSTTKAGKLASIGAAEMRTWVGPGRIYTGRVASPEGGEEQQFLLEGFLPKDFGVKTASEISGRLAFVYGEPWVADCAAGIRANCPADFQNSYVAGGLSFTDLNGDSQLTGSDGRALAVNVPIGGLTNPQFDYQPVAIGSAATKFVYVVATSGPNGVGRVLAAFKPQPLNVISTEVVSDLQRKLANELLGVDHAFGKDFKRYSEILTLSPNYCIEGVPHDFFVPLENELTSDSDQFEDSWKHYLDLAELAAREADALGLELINRKLEADKQKQAARETIGKLCGSYAAIDQVELSDSEKGTLRPPDDNSNLESCFDEPSTDVVFLTNDPFEGNANDAFVTSELKELLGCSGPEPRSELCGRATLSHAGLNKGIWTDPRKLAEEVGPKDYDCSGAFELVDDANAGALSGAKVSQVASAEWASPARLAGLLSLISLETEPFSDLSWTLKVGGSSALTCVVPGCAQPETPDYLYAFESDPVESLRTRNRIEGDLWGIAAMAGVMPGGVLNMPVPAVNFNFAGVGADLDPISVVDNDRVPFATVYGAGRFSGTNLEDPVDGHGTVFNQDIEMLRDLVGPIHLGYAEAVRDNTDMPAWIRNVYARAALTTGSDRFLHIAASNSRREYPSVPNSTPGRLKLLADSLSNTCRSSASAVSDKYSKFRYPTGGGSDVGKLCSRPNGRPIMEDHVGAAAYLFNKFKRLEEENGDNDKREWIPLYTSKNVWGHFEKTFTQADSEMPTVDGYDVVDGRVTPEGDDKFEHWTRRMLLPQVCSPGDRLQLFTNAHFNETACDQAKSLARSLALACSLQKGRSGISGSLAPPQLTGVEDLYKLDLWLARLETDFRKLSSALIVPNVPDRALGDQATGKVGTGLIAGTHGDTILQMEKALSAIAGTMASIAGEFKSIRDNMSSAQIGLEAAKIRKDSELERLAIEKINNTARQIAAMAATAASAAGSIGALAQLNIASAISGGIQAGVDAYNYYATKQIGDSIHRLEELAGDAHANTVAEILQNLDSANGQRFTTLQNLTESLRSNTASAQQASNALKQNERDAQYAAAAGLGADYYKEDGVGSAIMFPVNTVNRRLTDVAELRYREALRNAKYLTYMARLAIEQRIGERLQTIKEPVGALEAPATWEHLLCDLEGIDYSKLSTFKIPVEPASGGTGGAGGAGGSGGTSGADTVEVEVQEFANQYIGDYVTKLKNFVEYYNIEYPSHESDDTAVLSLRDDLIQSSGQCFAPSRNLLLFSSNLAGTHDVSGSGAGWVQTPCYEGDPTCSVVAVQEVVRDQNDMDVPPPLECPNGGVTVLEDVPESQLDDPANPSAVRPSSGLPSHSAAQAVWLEAGTSYSLSWYAYDLLSAGIPYEVHVLDDQLAPVVSPFVGPAQVAWERKNLTFAPSASGYYWIAFASSSFDSPANRIAIANTQLEVTPSNGLPSAYQDIAESRTVLSSNCTVGSPAAFRNAFEYLCDSQSCFYELKNPVHIDMAAVVAGQSSLSTKLARGNFNFRHLTMALNVVGTGVLDCGNSESSSCYGTGVLDYDLTHDAFEQPVLSWRSDEDLGDGSANVFSFGSASIFNGKALTAERFITLPISGADQSLLNQPQTTKAEFRGRPLSGSYTLRIYDTPALAWNRVEDVQLVLNYRYWSKIRREQ
ncbi:MAG: hypothetical protein R3B89_34055 [Polyangiaceae bacterium]